MSSPNLPDWPRAHGASVFAAHLRSVPEDFQVTEQLGWELSGDGEHDYLWVEKTSANTEWVSRQLAHYAGVPAKDIGYAGLKDRHAITKQWFSVPRWNNPNWSGLTIDGVKVLQVQRHIRKLRRGAHRANTFRIVLRYASAPDFAQLSDRLSAIEQKGVPNYFGEQRFGRQGGNLRLANDWAKGKRLPRHKRSLAISTIRSFLFNEQLAKRVEDDTWYQLLVGNLANLDGSGSVFEVTAIDDELRRRCDEMDVNPAGILAGDGSKFECNTWQAALDKHRIEPGSRSLRLRVSDLNSEHLDEGVVISFSLGRGAFATSVLREFCDDASQATA